MKYVLMRFSDLNLNNNSISITWFISVSSSVPITFASLLVMYIVKYHEQTKKSHLPTIKMMKMDVKH